MAQKKIAVVLSGCGFLDGTEITEAISALIALSEAGAFVQCYAPDVDFTPVDHHDRRAPTEKRNALQESGRIARKNVEDIKNLVSESFDGVIFPGGFGAAKNLCDFAVRGAKCSVHPEVERVIRSFFRENKPIGAICIAPALIARVLGSEKIEVTIGNDTETAREVEKTGATHVTCTVDDYVSDRDHKILTTPAYMYEATPFQAFTGIRLMVRELVEMA